MLLRLSSKLSLYPSSLLRIDFICITEFLKQVVISLGNVLIYIHLIYSSYLDFDIFPLYPYVFYSRIIFISKFLKNNFSYIEC